MAGRRHPKIDSHAYADMNCEQRTALRVHSGLLAALWAITIPQVFAAEPTPACEDATRQYERVARDLGAAIQRYTTCVSGSRGRNACSVEFSQVRATQATFEDAVAALRRTCT
jgi:hypothetical protein